MAEKGGQVAVVHSNQIDAQNEKDGNSNAKHQEGNQLIVQTAFFRIIAEFLKINQAKHEQISADFNQKIMKSKDDFRLESHLILRQRKVESFHDFLGGLSNQN